MDEDGGGVSPDLKDLEMKLGRKAPESLVRFLTGGKHSDKWAPAPHLATCKFCANSADLKRLESKMSLLKQEMVRYTVNSWNNYFVMLFDLFQPFLLYKKVRQYWFFFLNLIYQQELLQTKPFMQISSCMSLCSGLLTLCKWTLSGFCSTVFVFMITWFCLQTEKKNPKWLLSV